MCVAESDLGNANLSRTHGSILPRWLGTLNPGVAFVHDRTRCPRQVLPAGRTTSHDAA
ncbi:hypothetical protein FM114_00295 [Luteococcus japonicus LSP_Lj1]|uniref:Uncharacterized protein n=1 Tax=Luteococcus japonicus LSP_Lj1 TaxID=1255658 RepID=A0A1R4I7I6_9ACTN|nr:hypothetical protein FM114_00295 [Luteococcus japonicus LSP_Lj1]